MMQCSKKRGFPLEESKTREMAQQYLVLEENTQYLTHLKRWQSHRPRIPLKPQHLCQFRSWAAVVVQLSYLLYTCYVKQISVLILKFPCLLYPSQRCNQKQIFLQYLLRLEYQQLASQQQITVGKYFEGSQFFGDKNYQFCKFIVQKISYFLDLVGGQFEKRSRSNSNIIKRQFQSIKNIICSYLQPLINKLDRPQLVLQSLEESVLFRQNSDLVKIINNSIFTNIRSKPKSCILKVLSIQKALKIAKINSYSLLYSKYLEKAIEEMLIFFAQKSIIKIEQSINQLFEGNQRVMPSSSQRQQRVFFQKKFVLWQMEQQNNIRKLRCKILVMEKQERNFDQYLLQSILEGKMEQTLQRKTQSVGVNQILFEFISENGQISVSYITDILLNSQNADTAAFQCNYLPYNWGRVRMEAIEKSKNKKIIKKENYLGFTIKVRMHEVERPLVEILMMIDLLIVTAQIAYPVLKKATLRPSDYGQMDEVSLKIQHMINLFVRKEQIYYKKMSQSKQIVNCQKITL